MKTSNILAAAALSLLAAAGAHATLQADIAARDEQRLSAWTEELATVSASLQQEWQQAGAHTASQQQQLFDALAQTARDMGWDVNERTVKTWECAASC